MSTISGVQGYWQIDLMVTETSTDSVSNTSSAYWELWIRRTYASDYPMYGTPTINISISGKTAYSGSQYFALSHITQDGVRLLSGTVTDIAHNADGSIVSNAASFTWSGSGFSPSSVSGSGTYSASTIARYFSQTPTLEVTAKTETSLTIKWTTSEPASRSQYRIGSTGNWVDVETNINKTTGTMTITGLTAGQAYTIYGDFMRKDSGLWCQTKPSIDVTMHPYPSLVSASNFTIGTSIPIKITNPLNRSVTIYIKGQDNSTICTTTSTSNGNISITSSDIEINAQYASIPSSNEGNYKVRVVCSAVSSDITSNGAKYYTNISDCSPSFSTFSVEDINSTTTTVTGDSSVFIKGYSKLGVTILGINKMTTQKSATPKNYVVNCDTLSQTIPYSANDITDYEIGTIPTSGSGATKRVTVYAYDSRNNSANVYLDIPVYDYTKPTINSVIERLNNFENQTTISVDGIYSALNIGGSEKNTILSVQYRYKETSATWTNVNWDSMTVTAAAGSYHCTDTVISLDNTKSFDFEFKVTDRLGNTISMGSVDVGKAIFFISSNLDKCFVDGDFDVTGDTNIDGNTTIGGNTSIIGNAAITGTLNVVGKITKNGVQVENGIEQSATSLDNFKTWLINTAPVGSYLVNLNMNGSITCAIVEKASSSYLSFIHFSYGINAKQYRYTNGTWTEVILEKYYDKYQTSEFKTNKRWIDDKPIYRNVINTTQLVTNDTTISHGIQNVDRIWIDKAFMTNNDGVTWDIPIDLYGVSSTSTDRVGVCVGKSVIQFKCDTTWDTWWTKTIILEYTKTTD